MTTGMSREYPANAKQTYRQDLKSLQLEIRKLWKAIKRAETSDCCIAPNQSSVLITGYTVVSEGHGAYLNNNELTYAANSLPETFGDGNAYTDVVDSTSDISGSCIEFKRSGNWMITIDTTSDITGGSGLYVLEVQSLFTSAGYTSTPISVHQAEHETGSSGKGTYSFLLPANVGDQLCFTAYFSSFTIGIASITLSMNVRATYLLSGSVPVITTGGGGG